MINLRWTALAAFVASTIAFALSVVLLVAGSTPKLGQGHFWLAVNTSKTGQDLVQISTATDDTTNDVLELPALGDIFGGIVDSFNEAIDQGIQDLQGQIVGNLSDQLGIRDVYRFFLSGICEGDFVDDDDPKSVVQIDACYSYSANRGLRNISNSIPSSFVIGATNVSVPLVAVLGSSIDSLVELTGTVSKFMFALILIGAITTGIMLFASVAFFAIRPPRILVTIGALLTNLGSASLVLVAAAGTGIIFGSTSAGGPLTSGLGTELKKGKTFVVIVWVAAAFAIISATYWGAVWFVEFRRSSYRRRIRTEEEMGNWRGILSEVMSDLLGDRAKAEKSPQAVD